MYLEEVHYLDVGQGDCTVIIIRNQSRKIVHTTVFDCGSRGTSTISDPMIHEYSQSGISYTVLVNTLKQLEVKKIDMIVISHYDKDHYNGIIELLEQQLSSHQKYIKDEFDNWIINLLMGTIIYDQGIVFLRRTRDRNLQFDDLNDYLNSDRGAIPIKDFKSNFRGRDNYLKYSYGIYNANHTVHSGIVRKTEAVFVGHFKEYDGQNHEHIDRRHNKIRIQSEHWIASDPNTQYYSENVTNIVPVFEKKTVIQTGGSQRRPRKFEIRELVRQDEIPEDGFVVTVNPVDWLVGKDLYEGLPFNKEIKLICAAANGFTLQENGNNDFSSEIAFKRLKNENMLSIGLVLIADRAVHWYGGDLEHEQEDSLIPYLSSLLAKGKHFIMKASHHGSNESTSEAFLNALKPKTVIISAGNGNELPGPDTIERLEKASFIERIILTGADEKYTIEKGARIYKILPKDTHIPSEKDRFFLAGLANQRHANIELRRQFDELEERYNIKFNAKNQNMLIAFAIKTNRKIRDLLLSYEFSDHFTEMEFSLNDLNLGIEILKMEAQVENHGKLASIEVVTEGRKRPRPEDESDDEFEGDNHRKKSRIEGLSVVDAAEYDLELFRALNDYQ